MLTLYCGHMAWQILAYVSNVRGIEAQVDQDAFTLEDVEANPVRCPDQDAADRMYKGSPAAQAC